MNGELPTGNHPKLAVVMIGTNDLGYTESCFRNASDIAEAAPGTISRSASLLHCDWTWATIHCWCLVMQHNVT